MPAAENERKGVSSSLLGLTIKAGLDPNRTVSDRFDRVQLSQLVTGTSLGTAASEFRGRTVLLHVGRQLSAALALLELDGIASRIVICPPDLAMWQVPAIIEKAGIEIILSDGQAQLPQDVLAPKVAAGVLPITETNAPRRDRDTEWLLFTSGTTGVPKLAIHTLRSLIGPMQAGPTPATALLWSSFYDIRRYGGLQILLRAMTGGGSMLLSDANEPVGDFLGRAGNAGVTHISGTPSHWRRALISPVINKLSPTYVRLSGEIADQIILNNLRAAFPSATISHAFASTEAGVGFDVRDGLPGFPAAWIGRSDDGVEMHVKNGSLHIRSERCSSGYAGEPMRSLYDQDGFVDTGDLVVLHGDRYFFTGRREGVINVGGLKVHPEEVEAVINLHPAVRMSLARPKSSPITGAVVVADIVLHEAALSTADALRSMRNEIFQMCRDRLPAHKVPVILHQVPQLELTPAGKLLRRRA